MNLLDLFWTFIKLGAISFGGGYTIVAIAQDHLINKKKWLNQKQLLDYLAISQTLPGIIAINFSAFVGYKRAGILGACIAVLGIICVPLIIILMLVPFIHDVLKYPVLMHALWGVKIAVCGLIFLFVFILWKNAVKNWLSFLIFLLTIILYLGLKLSPIIPIVSAAIFGLIYYKKTKKVFNE